MESERLYILFFHITAWGVPFVITVVAYFFNGVQLLADLETGYKCWSGMKKLARQCVSGQLLQERAGPS